MNNLHILQHKMLERRYASDWESQLLMNETGKCSTRQLLILLTTNCTNIFCSPGWIPNVTFSLQLNYLNSSKLIEKKKKLQQKRNAANETSETRLLISYGPKAVGREKSALGVTKQPSLQETS